MRLSKPEFEAMSHPLRRLMQRHLELPLMRRAGLDVRGKDVLELGCGSGYGAELLLRDAPQSYLGTDLMEEQIELARQRGLQDVEFVVADATDLAGVPDGSKDVVAIFGILHHIPNWRKAVDEAARVLRPGGALVVEEPGGRAIELWDRVFKWGHPADAGFGLSELADYIAGAGFTVEHQFRFGIFGVFGARRGTALSDSSCS